MTTWPQTTRAAIARRAAEGFGSGLYKVPYSQDRLVDGYRADCSGFACRALGLTSAVGHGWWGGLNTVTLVTSGAVERIDPDDLQRGDLCGNMGSGTAGDDGHVVVFDRWSNSDPADSHHWIWEQCGNTTGPIHREIDWPYPGEGDAWKAYRYVGVTGDNTTTPDSDREDDVTTRTSLALIKPQPIAWGKFSPIRWQQENTDPSDAHADGDYPGFVSPRDAYVDLDVYLMVEGLAVDLSRGLRDEIQVRTADHTWKPGKGSVATATEFLGDQVATSGRQPIRVSGSLYLHRGHHLYIETLAVRIASPEGAPAPRIVSGVWRIRQDG